jgi:type II secretory pathway component PulF
LLYPLIILSLVAILSTVLLGQLVRQYEHFQAFQEIGSGPWPWLDVQLWAARWVGSWIWLPAVLILACAVIWRVRSGRASPSGIHRGWIRWLPGGRRMLLAMQRANFSDLLAILIDHQVPLPDAVRLAAGASGVGTMERDVERWAEALERGQTSGQRAKVPIVSPLAGWFLDHAANSELLVQALRSSAQADRRRADAQAAWLRLQLPLLLTFLIGGSLTAIYAFAVMGPWYNLLRQMERLL